MEIGIHQKNIITLMNKADLLFKQSSADDLTSKAIPRWIIDENQPCLLISAVKQQGTQQLNEILAERVRQIYRLRYPFKTRYDDLE